MYRLSWYEEGGIEANHILSKRIERSPPMKHSVPKEQHKFGHEVAKVS